MRIQTGIILLIFLVLHFSPACNRDNHTSTEVGNGTDSTADDTDSQNDTASDECEGIDFPVAGYPPSVLIVLDRSYSMSYISPVSWYIVTDALVTITEQMDYQIRFGLYAFPGETSCAPKEGGPNVVIADSNAQEIYNALSAMDGHGWGTPTAAALQKAYEYLVSLEDETPKIVVLATDGAPNCSTDPTMSCDTCVYTEEECNNAWTCLDDLGTYSKVTEYHDNWGINTYVVGLGGVEEVWDEVLDTVAFKGGTEHYYPADTEEGPEELVATLQQIAADNTACTFDVDWGSLSDEVIQDPMLVNVFANGGEMVYSEGCDFIYGWQWLDFSTIELCPGLCHDYKWGIVSSVYAEFGCATIIE